MDRPHLFGVAGSWQRVGFPASRGPNLMGMVSIDCYWMRPGSRVPPWTDVQAGAAIRANPIRSRECPTIVPTAELSPAASWITVSRSVCGADPSAPHLSGGVCPPIVCHPSTWRRSLTPGPGGRRGGVAQAAYAPSRASTLERTPTMMAPPPVESDVTDDHESPCSSVRPSPVTPPRLGSVRLPRGCSR